MKRLVSVYLQIVRSLQ